MNKLKPIARCLATAVLAGSFLPAVQADNLLADDALTTNINSLTLTNLSISCPAAADAFYVHQRTGCYAIVTFAGKSAVMLSPDKGAAATTLANGLVWSTDNSGVILPGACGTTGCISPLLGVDKTVTADGSVKVSATLTIGGITKTASTSVKLYAPIALKVSCPASLSAGGKVQIRFDPPQDDKNCHGSTYFSDGAKGDVTPFLKWSASDTSLATVSNPSMVTLLPASAPSPLVASYQPGQIQAANVSSDSKVNILATGAGLNASASLQISTKPAPVPSPVNLLISCPQVLLSGKVDRCYAGIRVNENIARLVNVKWSSSDKTVVSIDDDGKVTGGKVSSNTQATITATYTGDTPTLPPIALSATATAATTTDSTTTTGDTSATGAANPVTATTTITVVPAATLSGLMVSCSETLTSGSTGNCRAGATYSDDDKKDVTPAWTSSNASVATIDANGKVTALAVSSQSTVKMTGTYTEGGVTKTASDTITINPAGSTPGGGVPPLGNATIACFFAWAETQYPELFPGGGTVATVNFGPYSFRSYPINDTYLGIETLTNNVIYIGPFSGGALLRLGEFSSVWAKPSGCK